MRTNEERVQWLLAEQLGVEAEHCTPDKSLRADLHVDSLDEVEIGMALEDEFAIELDLVADMADIKTVGDIHTLVAKCLAGQSA